MQLATAHVLTALHALCHRTALTPGDAEAIARQGVSLSPQLWRETRALLARADAPSPGPGLDPALTPLILGWLGVRDEPAFAATYRVGLPETLARGRRWAAALAGVVERGSGAGSEALGYLVADAWRRRAAHLLEGLPETADAAIEALERALDACPWAYTSRRPLLASLRAASAAYGPGGTHRERPSAPQGAPALLASVLWCVTHDDLLLGCERGLDPAIERSPEAWSQVRAAVSAGRVEAVPIPVRTFGAWVLDDRYREAALRECLRQSAGALAELLRAVEVVWGRGERDDRELPRSVLHAVHGAVCHRRAYLEEGYRALPGADGDLWHEVHQGARRPDALARAELIRRLHPVLLRGADFDPFFPVSVWLDRAAECEAWGEHTQALAHVERVSALLEGLEHRPTWCGPVAVCVATHRWQWGQIDEARRLLRGFDGRPVRQALARIDAREPEREALRAAERVSRQRGDLDARCEVVLAHLGAGHTVLGERLAHALCREHPEEPLAWATLAEVLRRIGRHRDAVTPARTALARGHNRAPGRVLLARSLGRTGPEGRDQSRALAGRALEDHPGRAALRAPELAELAEIAHDGGADIRTCRRGDDAVWALRATEAPPCEWLGAAVARRCHGVWAEDAPLWLGRLAKVADDQPADLARFVVERVDALLHFRLLAGRRVFGRVDGLEAERTVSSRACERLLARHGLSAPSEAAGAAARAGVSLSYAGSVTGEAVEPAVRWQLHLAAIEATFGRDLAVRMRASELVQGALFGPDGAGERETLVHIETLDAERAAFIEWAAWRGALQDIAEGLGGGHSAGTAARVRQILDIVNRDDDEIRRAVWTTRWHEARSRGVPRVVPGAPDAR